MRHGTTRFAVLTIHRNQSYLVYLLLSLFHRRSTAFAILYRTYSADSSVASCPSDYPAFIQELRDEHLSGLLTLQGEQVTLVAAVDALAAVSVSSAYSFYLSVSVAVTDIAVLEANLMEKWRATFAGSCEKINSFFNYCIHLMFIFIVIF